MASPGDKLVIKVFQGDVGIRRRIIKADFSFQDLQQVIASAALPVPPDHALATFVDGDGDRIRISTEEDWQDALDCAQGTLKLTLEPVAGMGTSAKGQVEAIPATPIVPKQRTAQTESEAAPATRTTADQPSQASPEAAAVEDEVGFEAGHAAPLPLSPDSIAELGRLALDEYKQRAGTQHADAVHAVEEALGSLALCASADDAATNLQAMLGSLPDLADDEAEAGTPPACASASPRVELRTPTVPCQRNCMLLFKELQVYLSSLRMLVTHERFGMFAQEAFSLIPALASVVLDASALDLTSEEGREQAIKLVVHSGVVLPIIELFVAVYGDIGVTTVSCNQDVLLRAGFHAEEVAAAVEAGIETGASFSLDDLESHSVPVEELGGYLQSLAGGEVGEEEGESTPSDAEASSSSSDVERKPYPGMLSRGGTAVWLPARLLDRVAGRASGGSGDAGASADLVETVMPRSLAALIAAALPRRREGRGGCKGRCRRHGRRGRRHGHRHGAHGHHHRRSRHRGQQSAAQLEGSAGALKPSQKHEGCHGRWRRWRRGQRSGSAEAGGHGHHHCGSGRWRRHRHCPKPWAKDSAAVEATTQPATPPPAHSLDQEDCTLQAAIAASLSAGRTMACASTIMSTTASAPATSTTADIVPGSALSGPASSSRRPFAFETGNPIAASAPAAKFVAHVTVSKDSSVQPGETFLKVWRVQNSGHSTWPEGCRLINVGGNSLGVAEEGVPVQSIAPGETVDISLALRAPAFPGRHVGYFRLVSPDGTRFGHRFWHHMLVDSSNASKVLATLRAAGQIPPASDAVVQTSPTAACAAQGEGTAAAEDSEGYVLVEEPAPAQPVAHSGRVAMKARVRSETSGTEGSFEGALGSASMEASVSDGSSTPVAAQPPSTADLVHGAQEVEDSLPTDEAATGEHADGAAATIEFESAMEAEAVANLQSLSGQPAGAVLEALRAAGGDANRAANTLLQ